MQTVATATYGWDSIAAWETATEIVGLLDENEPLLARVAARAYTLDDLERPLTSQGMAKKSDDLANSPLARHGNPGNRQILPKYRQVDGTFPCQSVSTTKRSQLVRDETRLRELLSPRSGPRIPSTGTKSLQCKSVRAGWDGDKPMGLAYGSPWQPLYGMGDR